MAHEVTTTDTGGLTLHTGVTGATTLRTLKQRFSQVYNVKDFGCAGNGTTDDTVNFQACVDQAIADGVPVYVPKGTYILNADSSSAITIDLTGNDFEMFGDGVHSVLKRKDNATPSNQKRIIDFTTSTTATDKCYLHDLYFDGNAANNPLTDVDVDAFEFQHNAAINFFITDGIPITTVIFDRITFNDPMADNIWFPNLSGNGDGVGVETCICTNIVCTNRNRTRSDITVTGTLRRLIVDSCMLTRLERELNNDPDSERYFNVSNTVLTGWTDTSRSGGPVTYAGLDMGETASTSDFSKIKLNLSNVTSLTSTGIGFCLITASNCLFRAQDGGDNISRPALGSRFTNCTYLIPYDAGTLHGISLRYPGSDPGLPMGCHFDGCTFLIDADVTVVDTDIDAGNGQAAFKGTSGALSGWTYTPEVRFTNCIFDSRFRHCISAQALGKLVAVNNIYRCQDAAIFYSRSIGTVMHLYIEGGDFSGASDTIKIGSTTADDADTSLFLSGTFDDDAKMNFSTTGGSPLAAINRWHSKRIILCDLPPTVASTPGFRGDRRILKAPAISQTNEWIALNTDATGADWARVAAVGIIETHQALESGLFQDTDTIFDADVVNV